MFNNNTVPAVDEAILSWQPSPNTRGSWDIIWKCIQTFLLCALVSVCTNVPAPGQRFDAAIDKIFFFLLNLLGPELVVMLAFGQYISARASVHLFQALGYNDWTIAHGFLADMGGIHVEPIGWKSFPVDAKQLHYLVTHRYMDYPMIDPAEIRAVSKVDVVTRLITLLQASAFLISTVGRLAQNLAVTTLELTVVANIFCTLVSFLFWWSKPSDVAIPRYYKLSATIQEIVSKADVVSGGEYRDTPLDFVSQKEWIASILWNYYVNILRRMHLSAIFKRRTDRPLQRIPTFKWIQPTSRSGEVFLTVIGMLYFGIFLGAWNFHFPSSAEQQIWRVIVLVQCSISLLAAIFSISEHFWQHETITQGEKHLDYRLDDSSDIAESSPKRGLKWLRAVWNMPCNNDLTGNFRSLDVPFRHLVVMTPICALYVLCRWFIIAEDIAGLRALPASAFKQVDWTPYLPWF